MFGRIKEEIIYKSGRKILAYELYLDGSLARIEEYCDNKLIQRLFREDYNGIAYTLDKLIDGRLHRLGTFRC